MIYRGKTIEETGQVEQPEKKDVENDGEEEDREGRARSREEFKWEAGRIRTRY